MSVLFFVSLEKRKKNSEKLIDWFFKILTFLLDQLGSNINYLAKTNNFYHENYGKWQFKFYIKFSKLWIQIWHEIFEFFNSNFR